MEPLPYQCAWRTLLRTQYGELWDWFASHRVTSEHLANARREMLATAYRLPEEHHPQVYELARRASTALQIDVPTIMHQGERTSTQSLEAVIVYTPDEAHLLLRGPVLETLSSDEVVAAFAREFARFQFWTRFDHEYWLTDQLIHALGTDPDATAAPIETLRIWNLNLELFCDRAALGVVQDPLVVIAGLVKLATGLREVDPRAYLAQADESCEQGLLEVRSYSEPDGTQERPNQLRARALRMWAEDESHATLEVTRMLESKLDLERLDLVNQQRVRNGTRDLLRQLLAPEWIRTDLMLAHARAYFPDLQEFDEPDAAGIQWLRDRAFDSASLRDYLCFVLLDFVTVDRDLAERPIAWALRIAEELGVKPRFHELAQRELRLRKRQLDSIENSGDVADRANVDSTF